MKQIKQLLIAAAMTTGMSSAVNAQSELQVIHNCADPAAATVDVYVNGTLAIPDFAFRTATPFIGLPSGVQLEVGIAPGNSSSVNDTLVNFSLTLAAGQKYAAIASGVLAPGSFAPNPEGLSTAFGLTIVANAQTAAQLPGTVDLAVNHGSTDAPAVDVIARNTGILVNGASYGDVTSYLSVPAGNYILDITPANNNSTIVASFQADLTSLAGGAGIVFASGFLDPSANQNGAGFGLFAALANGTVVQLSATSQARLQVIHNAADPAAAAVDVYLNGTLALDNFAFRAATPFIDVPAGVDVNIGVAPSTSTSANDTLVNFTVQFTNGQTYVAVANGVLNPSSFAANPDGISTAFTLFVSQDVRETAANPAEVDLKVVHGASDAPTVDVAARGIATLVDDAAYGDITAYLSVPPASYLLDVKPGNSSAIVASYTADLSSLAGASAVVFASGFLSPSANQNGAAFGLFAALSNGTVVQLPQTSQARLQVIHNAADPAAASVDVYVNGSLALDDFGFRTATPFIDVPAGVDVNIGVAPSTSSSANDTLVNFTVQFTNGQTYVAVANGVLNPSSFAANPDGISTAFTLFVSQDVRETAANPAEVDLKVVHGASDAPTVDVAARGIATLVDDAAYGDITAYISVPPASYLLDVKPGNSNAIVASYTADLSGLAGASAVVFASGFLSPSANQNGAAFGLFAALSNGTVVQLPQTSQARLQVIHNAADPAAASVDVYVNGSLALDDFGFRTATPFINVPGDVNVNIAIAPASSTSINDTITSFNVQFVNGETYAAIANGVLSPASFAVNPDGISTAFTLFLQNGIREAAINPTDVDFIGVHGATDAPTVDIQVSGGPILINDAAYSDITGYISVPAASYPLEVTPGNNNSVVVASYIADLTSLAGGSAVVFASGFLNPAANQNGESFGLYAALADGTVVPFSITTSIAPEQSVKNTMLFPNPAAAGSRVNLTFGETTPEMVTIYNIQGMKIREYSLKGNENSLEISSSELPAGMYTVNLEGSGSQERIKLIVQ